MLSSVLKSDKAIQTNIQIMRIFTKVRQMLLDTTKSYTNKIQKHEACGFAFKVVSDYPEFDFPMVSYRGENAGKHFVDSILDMEDKLMKILQRNIPIIITDEQEREFKCAENCIFCDLPFNDNDKEKLHETNPAPSPQRLPH